jgi:uncharacterized membrane protein
MNKLSASGKYIFAMAIIAIGVETIVCARTSDFPLGGTYAAISVIPWLPAIPSLAYLVGAIWIASGVGLLFPQNLRTAATSIGWLLTLCALLIDIPQYAPQLGSVSLRTTALEPLSIACFAFLLPEPGALPAPLTRAARWVLAFALIVFGVDHFLALKFIADLLPAWIPLHVFWVTFFGLAFIAGGLSIALRILENLGAAGIGLMFGIWVLTLHLPRVLGLYGIPGAPRDPDEWSSLFIAVAFWGGSWALVLRQPQTEDAAP